MITKQYRNQTHQNIDVLYNISTTWVQHFYVYWGSLRESETGYFVCSVDILLNNMHLSPLQVHLYINLRKYITHL